MKNWYDNDWLAHLKRWLRQPVATSEQEVEAGWAQLQERLKEVEKPAWKRWLQRRAPEEILFVLLFLAAGLVFMLSTYQGNKRKADREEYAAANLEMPQHQPLTEPEVSSQPSGINLRRAEPKPAPEPVTKEIIPSSTSLQTEAPPKTSDKKQKEALALLQGNYLTSSIPDWNPGQLVPFQYADNTEDEKRLQWEVGLAASPVWHVNQRKQISRIRPELGLEAGLILDYRLGSRWHLSSGGFVMAQISALKAPEENRMNARRVQDVMVFNEPDYAEGYLVILNVPLNLRYNWAEDIENTFFTQIGVSNYMYLRERFHISYDRTAVRENGQGLSVTHYQTEGTQTRTGRVDMLSTLNLSAGYRWQLTPKTSFQVEPFLYIPLRNLTSQHTRFYTTGARLRFSFHRK